MAGALDGYAVAVTADRRADEQIELLRRHGAKAIHGPTLRTIPLIADGGLREVTDELLRDPPQVVFANTGIGMRAWLSAAESWGLGLELGDVFRDAEVIGRGPKAAGTLVTIGCDVRWRGMSGRLSEVIDHLLERPLAGVRIAYQRDGAASDAAPAVLRAAGADVVEIVTYRWLRPEDETGAIRLLDACCERSVDAVTFTSRPAIENLFALAAERGQVDDLVRACEQRVLPVCVGPVCHDAALVHGLRAAVAPPRSLLGAMVNTTVDSLSARRLVIALRHGELALNGSVATLAGNRIELSVREAAVLGALARRPGAVIAKHALMREVWGDESADQHALEMTISRLRRQLGDAGDAIHTVVRRGYVLSGTAQ